MYISEATYSQLNSLLGKCFQMNSFCDNIAYNLGYIRLKNAEPIFHEKYAHAFPALADVISELMLKLAARPVRTELNANMVEYDSIQDMFTDLKNTVDEFRDQIIKTIEIADINYDSEVRISMENFLTDFLPFVDQANTWMVKAISLNDDIDRFDHYFEKFTTIA